MELFGRQVEILPLKRIYDYLQTVNASIQLSDVEEETIASYLASKEDTMIKTNSITDFRLEVLSVFTIV